VPEIRHDDSLDATNSPDVTDDGQPTHSAHREFLLWYLACRDRPVPLSELTSATRSWTACRFDDAPYTERESLSARLYHDYLPRMAEEGLVEWFREGDTIYAVKNR
jgi:hypothetical protein